MNQAEKIRSEAKPSLEPSSYWSKTYQSLKDTLRPSLYLSLLGIAIPLLILDTYFDWRAQGTVDAVLSLDGARDAAGHSAFSQLFALLSGYAFHYLVWLLATLFIVGGAYLGLVHTLWRYLENGEKVPAWQAFKRGFRLFARRGALALLSAVVLVAVTGQFFYFLALVLAIATMALPVALVAENRGIGWSLRHALGFGFLKIKGILQLSLVFRFLSLGMVFYAGVALLSVAADVMLQFDGRLPVSRWLWMAGPQGVPFSYLFLGLNTLLTLVMGILFQVMAAATTVFYMVVRNVNRLIVRV